MLKGRAGVLERGDGAVSPRAHLPQEASKLGCKPHGSQLLGTGLGVHDLVGFTGRLTGLFGITASQGQGSRALPNPSTTEQIGVVCDSLYFERCKI